MTSGIFARAIGGVRSFVPYIAYISAVLSLVALWVVLWDRRPKLTLRSKKGRWIKVSKGIPGGWILEGVIEAYNLSSRANTIREYSVRTKQSVGNWTASECEQFTVETTSTRGDSPVSTELTMNVTPLVIPPYSGVEVPFAAVVAQRQKPATVRVEVVDLFGKTYSLEAPIVRD